MRDTETARGRGGKEKRVIAEVVRAADVLRKESPLPGSGLAGNVNGKGDGCVMIPVPERATP